MHNKGSNENVTDKAKSRSLNISMITLTRSVQGHPTAIFGKISVRKTIWELEFSEHLL